MEEKLWAGLIRAEVEFQWGRHGPWVEGGDRNEIAASESTSQTGTCTIRKLKMPIFDGEDAYGWMYKVERHFPGQ